MAILYPHHVYIASPHHINYCMIKKKLAGENFGEFGESTLVHQNILAQYLANYRECIMTKTFPIVKHL